MTLTEEKKQELIKAAIEVKKKAYAPYSNYHVGAALLTKTGQTFLGVNVENAAYPDTICAERSAVVSAVSAGERDFEAIAIATRNGGTPCGSCRQVLAEFGLDIEVLLVDENGNLVQQNTVRELLPGAFQPQDLSE
ncbi:MAG: cytidine deaminase [Chloroflexota bacterium]|nr:MAG: cytidine deaminase [Chloroflexota bacterium]HDD62664.1 cytidine deaminase [Chloroflexota bacterium]